MLSRLALSILTDFAAFHSARTRYPQQVLDVFASKLGSSLHGDVLVDKNTSMKLLGSVGGIK
jgi:hypothetical protein